ncbi:MAG TPA: hypothetical protein VFK13_07075 [Gemmatimonadaceae bacterium]|nr:hypothetical protein [Gemmatimonadaceae bacterium]
MILDTLPDEVTVDLSAKGFPGVTAVYRPMDLFDKARWFDAHRDSGVGTLHLAASGAYFSAAAFGFAQAGGGGGASGSGGAGRGGNTADLSPRESSRLGAGQGVSDAPIKIEFVYIERDRSGKETARIRRDIQRLDDRNQPIRLAL